ncbi:MAG TPA: hypothetical protein VKV20_17425 [Ktedonobacteraceae bacterium]|jgi:hypothetical protein|nr:hypothetical protein [Ktedonobacteraceae bacterium]
MNSKHPSLERLALLAQGRPNLLAGPLALYQEQEGLDDQQLAAKLRCNIEVLPKLALCERPRPAPHFRQDIERIARYIQADVMQLALLIRAAESREALSSRQNAALPALLAARDYDDDEDEAGAGDE